MPVDATDLIALSRLGASRARLDDDALRPGPPTSDPVAPSPVRTRVAALAALAIGAGLVCGMIAPPASAVSAPQARPTVAGRDLAAVLPGLAPTAVTAFHPTSLRSTARPTAAAHPPAGHQAAARGVVAAGPAGGRVAGVLTTLQAAAAVAVAAPVAASAAAPAAVATVPKVRSSGVPTRPLPAGSGTGRRIVYQERTGHLWIVGADGAVLRDYPVTGRRGRPRSGTYHVFSKSPTAVNPVAKVRFDLMVRFAHGITGAPIGFHTIPRWFDGRPLQSVRELGAMIGAGGCVRQSPADAAYLYGWARVGDTVVVLP